MIQRVYTAVFVGIFVVLALFFPIAYLATILSWDYEHSAIFCAVLALIGEIAACTYLILKKLEDGRGDPPPKKD